MMQRLALTCGVLGLLAACSTSGTEDTTSSSSSSGSGGTSSGAVSASSGGGPGSGGSSALSSSSRATSGQTSSRGASSVGGTSSTPSGTSSAGSSAQASSAAGTSSRTGSSSSAVPSSLASSAAVTSSSAASAAGTSSSSSVGGTSVGSSSAPNSSSSPTLPAACAGGGDATAANITGAFTAAQITAMTRAHNNVRCNAMPVPLSMPAVEWDPLAAQVAQAHANRCMTMHNANRNADYVAAGGSGGLGENMYWGTGSHTVQGAVNLWAAEVSQYNLAANTCSGVCGHYTQIVWANTVRIGCGAAVCSGTTLVVCDYNPPGNFIGQRPYTAAP